MHLGKKKLLQNESQWSNFRVTLYEEEQVEAPMAPAPGTSRFTVREGIGTVL